MNPSVSGLECVRTIAALQIIAVGVLYWKGAGSGKFGVQILVIRLTVPQITYPVCAFREHQVETVGMEGGRHCARARQEARSEASR